MNVHQRGTTASHSALNVYAVDRWRAQHNGLDQLNYTCVKSSTNAPTDKGFSNSMLYTTTTAESAVDADLKVSIEKNVRFTDGSVVSNIIRPRLIPCIEKYKKKYEKNLNCLTPWGYNNEYTFKKFEGKDAGFKRWHTEHGPGNPLRILVWAFYANDACGTEFMNYPTVQAKRGRCVIWPAAWSHVHRSAPNKGVKYYISGWISVLYKPTSQTGT